jgi:hypothetical protein
MIPGVAGGAAAGGGGFPQRWLGAGYQNMYYSDSSTASSWTLATGTMSAIVQAMASNRTSLCVAVGELGQLFTSADGATWTSRTSSFGTSNVNGVAFGNGVWVAVGGAGKLATSTDGITWTQRTSGYGTNTIYAIAYGNGTWAAIDGNGNIRTATDPTSTWTLRTSTIGNGGYHTIYYDPTRALWQAWGDTGTFGSLASSADGITWTSRDASYNLGGGTFINNSSVLCMGGPIFLSADYDIQTSTNGTTWTNRTPASGTYTIIEGAVDNNNLMIFGGNRIQSSSDGTTWTDRGAPPITFTTVAHTAGLPGIR